MDTYILINLVLVAFAMFCYGFSFGAERIIACFIGIASTIAAVIILLVGIAIYRPEISFTLTSGEWALLILASLAINGLPFVVGYGIGRLFRFRCFEEEK